MQKNGNVKPSVFFCRVLTELCFWKKHGHDCKFEHCACVCAHHHADWDARLSLWETIWNQAFSMSEIYNQFRGSGNDRKIKVAVEGIKLTTGFWRYRPKRLLFELASRKSRTLGVDQKFLIFWRPRYIYYIYILYIYIILYLLYCIIIRIEMIFTRSQRPTVTAVVASWAWRLGMPMLLRCGGSYWNWWRALTLTTPSYFGPWYFVKMGHQTWHESINKKDCSWKKDL